MKRNGKKMTERMTMNGSMRKTNSSSFTPIENRIYNKQPA
jgi:hypothetical protein